MFQYNFAFEFARSIRCGWNLGNTFDCIVKPEHLPSHPTTTDFETAWGNPPPSRAHLEAIRDAGFDAVRIPVSWGQHIGDAPDYTIDPCWMERVDKLVREAFSLGFRIILNVHHDASPLGRLSLLPDRLDESEAILCSLWTQIANQFSDLGESLIFEVLNEPHTADDWIGTPERYAAVNRLNHAAVAAIRSTKGNNSSRYLMIPTYAASAKQAAIEALELPADDRIMVSIHAYAPTDFCLPSYEVVWAESKTTWGSKEDIDALLKIFNRLERHFISRGIPVILGEAAAVGKADRRSRLFWAAVYAKEAAARSMPCFWWDEGHLGIDGMGIFDRQTLSFPEPELVSILTGKSVGNR